jgi:hypothetical protein
MNKKLGLLVPLIAIAFFAASGCGGSGSDAPTKEDYIAEADGICKEADDEVAATVESTFGNEAPSRQQLVSIVEDELIPSIEGQLNDLRSLTPPEGDEDTVNAIYDALEQDLEALKADPVGAIQGEAFAESSRLAGEYGLTDCGGSS